MILVFWMLSFKPAISLSIFILSRGCLVPLHSLPFEWYHLNSWASLTAQLVKNLPATWETWVQSLGWEDPLEEGMATYSMATSILAWRIPMDRGAQWATVQGLQRFKHN